MLALDGLLRSTLAHARTVQHAGAQGGQAEQAWLSFLAERLPNRYCVERGELFDANGGHSQQQDIVVYDPQYSPLVLGSKSPKIVAEAVYAIIEVKSRLSAEYFAYARAKAASARALDRTSVPIYHAGGQYPAKQSVRQLAGLVADESGWADATTPEHIEAQLRKHPGADDHEALDLVFAEGIAASYLVNPDNGRREYLSHDGNGALAWFLLELLRGLSHLGTVAAIDYAAYRKAIN